jgi:hypothetical protein
MTFFHDLNKRLAALADKQDLHESRVAESEKWIQKAVNPAHKGGLHKALHVAQDKTIPKAKIEKATHSKNPKLRHMAQFAKNVANEGTCSGCNCAPCKCNEGNAFTGKLKATPKGEKFKLGDKTFKDTGDLEEGFKEMDAWLASREKEKGTGKFDKKERTLPGGMKATTYTRKHEDDEDDDKDAPEDKGGAPKKKGRPKSAASKDSERVTKGSHKYKSVDGKRVKKEKTKEGLDSDGVMMTRPTNCSSESIEHGEEAEYNDEAGMTKDSLHTIVRHAKELESALRSNENLPEWVQEKIGQIKGMMSSVTDYIVSTHERDAEQHTGQEGITTVIPEKAVSKAQRKFMGMAHAIQKGEKIKGASPELKKVAKSMKSTDTHDFAATKEKGLPKKVSAKKEGLEKHSTSALKAASGKDVNADKKSGVPAQYSTAQLKAELAKRTKDKVEEGGKPDFLDLDKDGNKTEPMKQAAKQAKGKKEEKVDETTVAGSVAPVANAAPKGKSGMQFGKGVYESLDRQFKQALSEGIQVQMAEHALDGDEESITVTATGEDVHRLKELLKLAGMSSDQGCGCGQTPCGCESLEENSPDWPTNTEKLDAEPNLRTYSGGLNGPKSTGQTTVPVVASQLRRQASMEESVKIERSLFNTWKNYKG